MNRHRIVIDTNVLISGVLFNGPPRRILELAICGGVRCFLSQNILKEFIEVLQRPKFGFTFEQAIAIADELQISCTAVKPEIRIEAISADPDDNRILECAVEAQADFIISGDSHLLDFGQFQGIEILSASGYLAAYRG